MLRPHLDLPCTRFWVLLVLAFGDAPLGAQSETPPAYADVRTVLQSHCGSCHGAEGTPERVGPMSLLSYETARPWARSIAREVQSRAMPPWHADDGEFANERRLSPNEIALILGWIDGGARRGRVEASASEPQTDSEGGLVHWFETPQPIDFDDEAFDRTVRLDLRETDAESPVRSQPFITSIEVTPSSSAVHHILAFARTPSGESRMLPGYLPGQRQFRAPDGYGIPFPDGTRITLQVHLHKEPGEGTGVLESPRLGIRFATAPVRPLHVTAVGDPRALVIPADVTAHPITSSMKFERPIQIWALQPHMHFRGRTAEFLALDASGSRTRLLAVPRYDFQIQTRYEFAQPLEVASNSEVEVTLTYDNTGDTEHSPDPPIVVKWGNDAHDEMNLGIVYWSWQSPDDDGRSPPRPF